MFCFKWFKFIEMPYDIYSVDLNGALKRFHHLTVLINMECQSFVGKHLSPRLEQTTGRVELVAVQTFRIQGCLFAHPCHNKKVWGPRLCMCVCVVFSSCVFKWYDVFWISSWTRGVISYFFLRRKRLLDYRILAKVERCKPPGNGTIHCYVKLSH